MVHPGALGIPAPGATPSRSLGARLRLAAAMCPACRMFALLVAGFTWLEVRLCKGLDIELVVGRPVDLFELVNASEERHTLVI